MSRPFPDANIGCAAWAVLCCGSIALGRHYRVSISGALQRYLWGSKRVSAGQTCGVGWFDGNRKRVHRRAVQRQDKGYSASLRRRVVSVTDAEWVSQFDAAERLHISMWAVGSYISTGRLTPAENPAGQGGVTRVSVEAEAEWRRGRRLYGRFWRRVKEQLRII